MIYRGLCELNSIYSNFQHFYLYVDLSDTLIPFFTSVNDKLDKLSISDHELRLGEFGHYFAALLVSAFTFLNSEMIKDGKKKKDFMDKEGAQHDTVKAEYSQLMKHNSLQIVEESKIRSDSLIKKLDKNFNQQKSFLDGENYKPFLYSVGAIYLSFLIVIGVERPQNEDLIFIFIFLISLIVYLQQLFLTYFIFIKPIKKWYTSTGFAIAFYIISFFVIASVVSYFGNLTEFLKNVFFSGEQCLCHNPRISIDETCKILKHKYLITLMALAIPVMPYLILLLRELIILRLYKIFYNNRFDELKHIIRGVSELNNALDEG